MSAIPKRRLAGLALLILSVLLVSSPAQTPPQEIALTLRHGPAPLDVTLQWTGGSSPFEIYRSPVASSVCSPDHLLATTDVEVWIDPAPPGTAFYRVHSATAGEPPEVCNGRDDDCDGIVDNGTTDCDAGTCQDCIGGACRSRCGPCDTCVNGVCQSTCGSCQTCVNGTCAACDPGRCETCVSGVCQSTCDATQCQTCGPGGACITFCATCETCISGECFDACDRGACLSCQSGSCQPFCDPICQTCTAQGCRDNCGPCQRCVGGTCQNKCNPNECEDCVAGACQYRCGPTESCVGGTCQPGTTSSQRPD